MNVTIWTDGGCHGNPGPGAWAYIITEQGCSSDVLAESSGGEKCTTNNKMELTAVIESLTALALLPATRYIEVCTDSQYVQKGITEWIYSWKAKGWRTSGKQPVKNIDLWQKLDTLAQQYQITWKWVKGHAGVYYNERCDTLVQKAIASL
jgi:ribonuclease HI